MALTKYQKLARGLKALLHHLNDHYQKTAAVLNAVEFSFFEISPLPKTLQQLEEAKLEALLYCASAEEMSEWIDWFEREDQANTLFHQLLAVGDYYRERAPFEERLNRLAFPLYRDAALEYYKKIEFPKVFKTLKAIDFAPSETSSIAESYELIIASLKNRNKRHFDDFQKFWRNRLRKLMFDGLKWTFDQQESALAEYFPPKESQKRKTKKIRWDSSCVIDRQTYGRFIQYFVNRFLRDPSRNKVDGEIALLLWVMIYVSREPLKICPVSRLLQLTTADVDDRILFLKQEEIEFSCGLANLIQEFVGTSSCKQQKKLFPHLTIDKLEDRFHKASKALLLPGNSSALPEAFLTFPHGIKNVRMVAQLRRMRQQQNFSGYDSSISWKNIKSQLFKNIPKQH